MTPADWMTIAAIIIGPLAAVLITYYLQRRHEARQRRLFVFRALMTTRKTPLSPERVQALNLVDIEYYGSKKVIEKFQNLIEIYNDQARWMSDSREIRQGIIQEVDDRTSELLKEMGSVLGYRLDNLKLLRGGYYPEAFSQYERQQQEIRDFVVGLNNGTRFLPTAVVDYRHSANVLEAAKETQLLIEHAKRQKEEQKKQESEQ